MAVAAPPLSEIEAARERLEGVAVRTPLVRFPDAEREIWLKLENLQPIGSFKIRGAHNAIALAPAGALDQGVVTASAGNMAQGVAWCARDLGLPCTVIVPDHAPATKLAAVERLGARIIAVPFERWWRVLEERRYQGVQGYFVHPVSDPAVVAGNGTIGLELAEQLPEVEVVLVPYGGGGLSCGIAAALRALRPEVKVLAAEPETAAPLAASFAAGRAMSIDYRGSFIDGSGGRAVLPEMWPMASTLLAGSIVVTLAEVAAAIRDLVERVRTVAEGAGGLGLAAARSGRVSGKPVVCVVSGGNIDTDRLIQILQGQVPGLQ
jgi:threonine dehydratase